jgi:pyrroloquinoline quinone biosynthesis protein D
MIAREDILAVKPFFRLQWEEAQQAWVLLYPEGLVKLSPSAAEILQRVDGVSSAGAIAAALESAFPGADLRSDVFDFLEVAHGRGWIARQADR